MSRALDSSLSAALSSGLIIPVLLVDIAFKSSTQYIWSGVGTLAYNTHNYIGVGSLGKMGSVQEGVDVRADGTSITLSGIDPVLLNDCMTDIKPGAPATIYLGLLTQNGVLIGTPYKLYVGTVDQPKVSIGADTISITVALENRMVDLSRPSMRRYTSADQRLYHPQDSAFAFVEQLNDLALVWGS